MENHAMKLLGHNICADVNTKGGLESAVIKSAELWQISLHASALCNPAFYLVCHFVAKLLWFLTASTFAICKLTCCTGDNL